MGVKEIMKALKEIQEGPPKIAYARPTEEAKRFASYKSLKDFVESEEFKKYMFLRGFLQEEVRYD